MLVRAALTASVAIWCQMDPQWTPSRLDATLRPKESFAMKLSITSKFVEALKPTGTRQEFLDEKVRGLVLRVSDSGVRTWSLSYRNKEGDKQRYTIGRFPDFSLDEARNEGLTLKARIARNEDPAGQRRAVAVAPKDTTFRELFELRMSKAAGAGQKATVKDSTIGFYRGVLEAKPGGQRSIMDQIGDTPAGEIQTKTIVSLLDKIEARGATVQADHVKAAISGTYKWAMKRQAVNYNPCAGLGKRSQSRPRTRVPSEPELLALWQAGCVSEEDANCVKRSRRVSLSEEMRLILRLAVLTGQRRAEVCGARVDELKLDGANPRWIIPGDTTRHGKTAMLIRGRTKNSSEQVLPLSRQAVALWRQALCSARNSYVFPARETVVKSGRVPRFPHIDPHSVSTAIRRTREVLGIEDLAIHDLRRAIATWMSRNGVRPDVIDKVLNHLPQDVTRRHYNHDDLEALVRPALQAWADYIEQLVTVVPMAPPRSLAGEIGQTMAAG